MKSPLRLVHHLCFFVSDVIDHENIILIRFFVHLDERDEEEDENNDEHIHYSDSMNSDTSPLPTIEMIDLTTPSPDQSCSSEDQTDIMQIDSSPMVELSSE